MKTIICPKCKQAITITEGTEYVLCCDEVIYVDNNIKLDDLKTMKIAFDSIKESLMKVKNERLFLGDPKEDIAPDPYDFL